MKRLLPLLLALLLLLSACGAPTGKEAEPDPAETAEPDPSAEPSPAPIADPDEGELPRASDDDPKAAAPVLSEETVTLDGISSYLRVTLPEGWTWEQAGGTVDGTAYGLRPADDPDFLVELRWWSGDFGMCATGVTFQDYPLPDGRTAILACELVNEDYSWILILPASPDQFTIQFGATYALYEAHQAELELLLSTIQQGVLAGLDVVPHDEPTE